MKIGVVFPQVEIGQDPDAIREWAQAVEEMGYTHALAFDHVLGANPDRPGGWKGPYTYAHGGARAQDTRRARADAPAIQGRGARLARGDSPDKGKGRGR